MREFFEIFNIRFWWLLTFGLLPLWGGIIGCAKLMIEEKIEERRERNDKARMDKKIH